ncbi:predicted protein [Chaetoceros tenuissimus]|uniref:EGF-like domain-containing protein n=1 Tax=Chaetoceros tenuissimus TaxID=426638 RepID=A0AAD3H2K5_9STRA|nr:predicted protein [Chaetoceros tenuissimus]
MKFTGVYQLFFLFTIYSRLITQVYGESGCLDPSITVLCTCDEEECKDDLLKSCTWSCECDIGGCSMDECTDNCHCKGGNCHMPKCDGYATCTCEGGKDEFQTFYSISRLYLRFIFVVLGGNCTGPKFEGGGGGDGNDFPGVPCNDHCSCGYAGSCPQDLSTCKHDCSCGELGGCDMSQCTKHCHCHGGDCDMSCKGFAAFTCSCRGGGCTGFTNANRIVQIVVPIIIALSVLFCWWRKRKNRQMAETAYSPTQTQDQMFPVKQGA